MMTSKFKQSLFELLADRKISRMMTRVPRHVGDPAKPRGLTSASDSFTINTIRGDQEFHLEIQPHLNSGLWPVYLEECDMRFTPPPTDGRQEAPGAHPSPTPDPE